MCYVVGLGGFDGVYCDGMLEYYLMEIVCVDDIKGVSFFIMVIVVLFIKMVVFV